MAELLELDLIINAANSAKTVGELRQSLKDINAELNKAEAGSAAYNKLVTAAGKVKAELMDLKQEIKALDPDATAASFGKAIRGVAGGFQAATAAAALFGTESEELQKTLLKVQAAMALSAAIKDVQELGDAFKILNTIIKANPILFIISGLAALAIAIVGITDKYFRWSETVDELQEKLDEQKKTEEEITRITNNQITALEGIEGKEREILELRKLQIEEQLKTIRVSIALNAQKLKETIANDTLLESIVKLTFGEKAYSAQKLINVKEQLDAVEKDKKSLEELTALLTKSTTQITNFDEQEKKKRNENYKKYLDDKKKLMDEETRLEFEKNEIINQQILDHEKGLQKIRDEQKNKRLKDADEENKLIADKEKARNDEILKADKERLENEKIIADARKMIHESSFSIISSLGTIFINNQKKLEKFNKFAALTQIAIDTAQAISALVKNSEANPLNAPTGGIAGIAQFASGIARILANIAKAKQLLSKAGDTPTPSLDTGGFTATGGASQGVPINPVSNASTLLNPDGTVKTEPNGSDQRVYVLETDITRTQNKISSIENKAKIE